MKLSVIIPTLNEASGIVSTLMPLQSWREQGHEIIIADGGSQDKTLSLAQPLSDNIINAPKGRAQQMNAGAANASGDVLLFLHADTRLPDNAPELISNALHNTQWGRFDVTLSGHHFMFRIVEFMMNTRSRLTGIATGDQAIFIKRDLFEKEHGFANIPLMEDIEISKRLKKIFRPACIKERLVTSSRRWEQYGIAKTILLMWRLRLAYFFGTPPDKLAKRYR